MNKYTMEEVSKHNTENSLWLVIDKCVYDVTAFLRSHPGGDILLNYGGQNATESFDEIEGHGMNPKIGDLMAHMCIGIVE
jgi:cytochrome b involved in lipid metabolism